MSRWSAPSRSRRPTPDAASGQTIALSDFEIAVRVNPEILQHINVPELNDMITKVVARHSTVTWYRQLDFVK